AESRSLTSGGPLAGSTPALQGVSGSQGHAPVDPSLPRRTQTVMTSFFAPASVPAASATTPLVPDPTLVAAHTLSDRNVYGLTLASSPSPAVAHAPTWNPVSPPGSVPAQESAAPSTIVSPHASGASLAASASFPARTSSM